MLKEALADVDGLEVTSFSGLLVDFAAQRGIRVIVKGLRAVTDFDYELQMAQMNHQMTGLETFFVPTSPQWSYLSSSLIKEIVRFGGDVSGMVPGFVQRPHARQAPSGGRAERWTSSARLQQIESWCGGASRCPLSSSVLVNREEMLEVLEAARNELPEEIKQARWVVKDREELLGRRGTTPRPWWTRAQPERARLVSEQEVVRAAKEEAERILSEADEQSRQIRLEAEDYVDAKLAQFEIALEKTADAAGAVRSARSSGGGSRLRGVTPAEEEFGGGDDADDGPVRRRGGGVTVTVEVDVRDLMVGPAPRVRCGSRNRSTGMATELAAVPADRPVRGGPAPARAWSRGSWSPAPCRVRWTGRARGACAHRTAVRGRVRELFAARTRRGRRRVPVGDGRDRPRADAPRRRRPGDAVLAPVPAGLPGPVRAVRRRPQPRRVHAASRRSTIDGTRCPAPRASRRERERAARKTDSGNPEARHHRRSKEDRTRGRRTWKADPADVRRVPAVPPAQASASRLRQLRLLRAAGRRSRSSRRQGRRVPRTTDAARAGPEGPVQRPALLRTRPHAPLVRVRAGAALHDQRATRVPRRRGARAGRDRPRVPGVPRPVRRASWPSSARRS